MPNKYLTGDNKGLVAGALAEARPPQSEGGLQEKKTKTCISRKNGPPFKKPQKL